MNRRLLILLLVVFSCSIYAQFKENLALEMGYKNKYSNNLSIGLSYKLAEETSGFFSTSSWTNISIAYLTNFGGQNNIMLGVQEASSLIPIEFGLYVSTKKDIEPTLGFNLSNRIKVNIGYNIAVKRKNQVTFGVYIPIGLHKNSDYFID